MQTVSGAAGGEARGAASMRRMVLDQVLDLFARDGNYHFTNGPATSVDLRKLEGALGRHLPDSFRAFLERLGGGLFYAGHEIFGPHRVMVHDIELVPSLTTIRSGPCAERLPEGVVPFHRMGGTLHVFDLRGPAGAEPIVAFPCGPTYPDLPSFLEAEVIPPATT
jgi:SMI1 / KNR4 family (SUKH-1)